MTAKSSTAPVGWQPCVLHAPEGQVCGDACGIRMQRCMPAIRAEVKPSSAPLACRRGTPRPWSADEQTPNPGDPGYPKTLETDAAPADAAGGSAGFTAVGRMFAAQRCQETQPDSMRDRGRSPPAGATRAPLTAWTGGDAGSLAASDSFSAGRGTGDAGGCGPGRHPSEPPRAPHVPPGRLPRHVHVTSHQAAAERHTGPASAMPEPIFWF